MAFGQVQCFTPVLQNDGSWAGRLAGCSAVPCGPPTAPASGRAQARLKDGLFTAEFSCQPGFLLRGPTNLQCGLDQQWQFGM